MTASPESLIPALRQADAAGRAKLLLGLTLEQLKPIARAVAGIKRFNGAGSGDSLRETILKVLAAGRALDGAGIQAIGAKLRDESGEEIDITPQLVETVHRLSDDLQRAEYGIQRGLADICRSLAEFADIRGYAYFGFSSFRAYCQAGRLEVLGQKRSHSWAMEQIQMFRTFGEKLLAHVGPLPRRDLVRLASVLSGDGMEAALEEFADAHRLTYTGEDGQPVTLEFPKSREELGPFRQGIEMLDRDRRALSRALSRAQDDLVLAKEGAAQEADALRVEVAALQRQIADSQGRTDDVLAKLVAADGAALAPEDIRQLQAGLRESQGRTRQLAADAAAKQGRLEELMQRIEARNAEADTTARLAHVQQVMGRFREMAEGAIRELAPLREVAGILRPEAVTVVAGTIAAIEAQLRQIAVSIEVGDGAAT
jgi:hypothetical protein